jgi:hypothetical protein
VGVVFVLIWTRNNTEIWRKSFHRMKNENLGGFRIEHLLDCRLCSAEDPYRNPANGNTNSFQS